MVVVLSVVCMRAIVMHRARRRTRQRGQWRRWLRWPYLQPAALRIVLSDTLGSPWFFSHLPAFPNNTGLGSLAWSGVLPCKELEWPVPRAHVAVGAHACWM